MNQFEAPIPGQSLTDTPKNYPWENPPEISDPEEAIQMYLTKLSDKPETLDSAFDLLEAGMTVRELTSGLLRVGVANGIHSIDVGLLAAPVVHQYIKVMATESGVNFTDGFEDKRLTNKETNKVAAKLAKLEMFEGEEETLENIEEMEDVSQLEKAVMEEPEEKPQGLMARR